MRRSIALGLTILAAACHHAPATSVAPGCDGDASAGMHHADSIAALTGVFRVTIFTAENSYPEPEQDGFFWLTAGDTTHREPPWLSRDTVARSTIIGVAAWGANSSAPRQIDPRDPGLKYFDGSIYEGNYFIDIGSYGRLEIEFLGAEAFSGTWRMVMSDAVLKENGREYRDPHGTFCARRAMGSDSSSGRAKLTVLVTDTGGRRLTNVSVTAVDLFTRAPAGELRWRGDVAPDRAFFDVAPGTYLLRADGLGARRETRIVRATAGHADTIHFVLASTRFTPRPSADSAQ